MRFHLVIAPCPSVIANASEAIYNLAKSKSHNGIFKGEIPHYRLPRFLAESRNDRKERDDDESHAVIARNEMTKQSIILQKVNLTMEYLQARFHIIVLHSAGANAYANPHHELRCNSRNDRADNFTQNLAMTQSKRKVSQRHNGKYQGKK